MLAALGKMICSETRTVNDFSVGRQELEPFAAGGGVSSKPSTSFLDFKKEEYPVGSHDARSGAKPEPDLQTRIAIIDENALSRSCLMRCLSASEPNFITEGYSSVEDWRRTDAHDIPLIVLLCATGRKSTESAVRRDLDLVIQSATEARVIVVSDFEDSTEIVAALERGARGYIAMSSNLDVAIAAIRLVRAGGTFVPASGLLSSRSPAASAAETDMGNKSRQNVFTQRQLEVIDRLRQGESNKLIAYKLNMGECTVKVHVRNIMRKIKARNRTEIAFLTNELF
ncbi:LuxR C-terminal-related transcriptional regulator [Labrys okinawensis]|uniref:LuxR C-terminal-related transcriptional regulator n=1 Tax=Labrys okinawensis TaxID=346911 RepID=UPI0039BCECC9